MLCSQSEVSGDAEPQTMTVYLRVRPFSKDELSDNEDQVQSNNPYEHGRLFL